MTLDVADEMTSAEDGEKSALDMSRRERKKADKLQKIKDASLALFLTKGYDEATTREIARLAGVALGTLFVYAENKRDLLFLIYNDDLEFVLIEAERAVSGRKTMVENLMIIAELHLMHYARRPEISRYALREMYFYDAGSQSVRFHAIRSRLLKLIVAIIQKNIDAGVIRAEESAETIGNLVFAVFQFEVRRFLVERRLDLEASLDSFERQMRVVMSGLHPRTTP
ncbi:transcriptional regulator, TetR family [Devosia enhydra]|uniref:Transcriptional regulator, TetR family n=1 Tax=Devosia enhydra TaxID=665118 RepID=A0A1K2HY12_9HYPH|nr:TetR/AcrR family transcriptional regulator [Devosia enhydra]SFZ84631.1 transcriptional regulator, TetR family [Devosia enhydra]